MSGHCADRIAIMLRGWVVEMGLVEQVPGHPLHPYTQIPKSSVPEPDPRKKWRDKVALGRLEAEEYLQVGCKFVSRCPQASKYPAYLVPEQHYFHGGHYDDRHQSAL